MKKLLYLLILLSGMANAQIVNIPDAVFKNYLINDSSWNSLGQFVRYDANLDGEIQVSEALLIENMDISTNQIIIKSLIGIKSFANLKTLGLKSQIVTDLDISGMLFLESLNSKDAKLKSLNINGCIKLKYLNCFNNKLSILEFINTPNLLSIDVEYNNLINLDVSNLSKLLNLQTTYNTNLISLVASPSLSYLGCEFVSLTSLDLSMCTKLKQIRVTNAFRPFLYLNIKNGANELFTSNLGTSPSLICADDFQLAAVKKILQFGNTTTVTSYCSFTPGGNYNTITGKTIFDFNNNGCDSNDTYQPNIKVSINDGINQGSTFTNTAGNYTFYTDSGNFTLIPKIENPAWFTATPDTANVTFLTDSNNVTNQNFCITANGVHNDLEVVIVPVRPARPGFLAEYKIVYKNKGNQTLSGNVNFTFNDLLLDLDSAFVIPNSQSFGSLTWNFSNLLPFEDRDITVIFRVNPPTATPPVNIGDVLNFTATINPTTNDETPSDNQFAFNQTVVGSFDPNDITCLEGTNVPTNQIGEYLHYVVNFENTGTAAAEFVVVKDTIDIKKFDLSSLQIIHTSHNMEAQINGNIAEFIFPNINLFAGGHGNILFKIKTLDTLKAGVQVKQKADIYFDYNFPIVTNIANTLFQTTGISNQNIDKSIKVFPNPSNRFINIRANSPIQSIQLYDIQGRLLLTKIAKEENSIINLDEQAKGIYFLKIMTNKGIKIEKIVKD